MPRRPEARFDLTADDKTRATLERVDKRLGSLGKSAAFATRAIAGIFSVEVLRRTVMARYLMDAARKISKWSDTLPERGDTPYPISGGVG